MNNNRVNFIESQFQKKGVQLKVDTLFDGGFLDLFIKDTYKDFSLKWNDIKKALIDSDQSKIEISDQLNQFIVQSYPRESLTFVMIKATGDEYSSNQILDALNHTSLRPATLTELIIAAIESPEWFKPHNNPIGRMLALGSFLQQSSNLFQVLYDRNLPEFKDPTNITVPYFGWLTETRMLRTALWLTLWNDYDRFICVVEKSPETTFTKN